MKKIVVTNRIRETIEDYPKFKGVVNQSINKFEKNDFGTPPAMTLIVT